MTVKPVRSAQRVLATLEALAEHQPIGVGALARVLGEDKSAVQRALMTLAASGWIRPDGSDQTRWELTTRALVVAHHAQRRSGLRHRVRPTLEQLRDETGESVILAVPDGDRIVIVDVVESRHLVRTAPRVGMVIPAATSAAGQAILSAMSDDERRAFVGELTNGTRSKLQRVRARGWSLNDNDVANGATSVGAVVLDHEGKPLAGIAVSAIASRMPPDVQERVGARVAELAAALSTQVTQH
ncbi:MAG TPA: IclR family transcriptional regulator [Acidimicrobiales bacterium]